MPLPIAHSVISASMYVAYKGSLSIKDDYKWLALFMSVGLFPDVDFITVPFMGFGSHRGFTHSFLFAFIITTLIFVYLKKRDSALTARFWSFLFLTMAIHPLCDFFTYDYLVERGGVKLFSPFSERYFESPVPIFMGIELRYLHTIFSAHTLLALAYETFISGLLFLTVFYFKTGSLNLDRVLRDRAED
ncbi:MAG: metal-dependent hydrolase [Deltaproteobacteria bacterium]|nr:metal-dependent hydrolase [Deltaproteobacteria bacterium]